MKVNIDPDDVKKVDTDDRGRAYLGSEYKNSELEVAVLEVVDDGNPGCDVCGERSSIMTRDGDIYCEDCYEEIEDDDE